MSVVRRFLLLFTVLLVSNNNLKSQDCDVLAANLMWDFQVVIPPPSTTLVQGETFFVECFVTGFVDVLSFQYSLNYNPNVLTFNSIDNLGSPLIGDVDGNFTAEAQATGSVGLLWTNLNGEGQTIPDNSAIFKLFFVVVGDPDECSQWEINASFIDLEIAFELPNGDFCTELVDINFDLTGAGGGELCVDCSDLFLTTSACGTIANSGTIQFNACGGLAPYTYTVEGPSGTVDSGVLNGPDDIVTLTGLVPGFYQVDMFDSAGTPVDSGQGFIEVVSEAAMTVEIGILKDVVCVGSEGDLIAVADGGTQPYIFSWSNGLFSDTVEDIPEGTYDVTVTDANGCEVIAMPVTLEAVPLEIMVEKMDATCDGSGDGSYTITVTGGEPINGDTYIFDQQALTQGVYVDQNPGTYNILVSDANGCNELVTVDIGVGSFVGTFDIDVIEEIECFGDEAIIEIIADIQYGPNGPNNNDFATFTDPLGGMVPFGGPHPLTGNLRFLPLTIPGMYTGYFYTPSGCIVDVEFELQSPPEIVIDIVDQVDFDCSGNGGDITVEISGGQGALSPEWSTGENALSITVPTGGTYTLVVTDASMCSDSIVVDFTSAGSLGLTAAVVDEVGCGAAADSGSAEAMITGSAATITFQWLDDAGVEVGTDSFVDGLSAGTYTVIATDSAQDCSAEEVVTISGAGSFNFIAEPEDPTCFGGDDGEILINITAPATINGIAWSHDPGLMLNEASNLTAGDYTVTITDDTGCQLDTTITLDNPIQAEIFVDTDLITAVSCFGGADGSAFASVTGGAAGTDYIYSWENDMLVSTNVGETSEPTDLVSGELIVFAFGDGCYTDTVTVEIPSALEIVLDDALTTVQSPSCAGLDDGMIDIIAIGGTVSGDYTYEWDNGEMTSALDDLAPGDYFLTITDDNSCEQTFDFELLETDSLFLNLDEDETLNLSCFGANTAVITVEATGGSGDYEYTWLPDVSSTAVANDVGEGQYVIQVNDSAGCSAEITYEIEASVPIEVTVADVPEIPCAGGMTEICLEASGGSGNGFMYQINFGNNTPVDSCALVSAGEYNINITDGAGCPFEETINIVVDQPEPITIEVGEDTFELELGDTSLVIEPIINGPNPIDSIIWSSETGAWDCIDPDCFTVNVSPTVASFYNVQVIDENGCTTRADIFVNIKTVRNVWAPNIFSPDQDGNNDIWHPFTGPGVRKINSFQVYDRWGNLMHSAEDVEPGDEILFAWDGRFNGDEAAQGVYVYIAEVEFVDDVVQYFKGSVTLTR